MSVLDTNQERLRHLKGVMDMLPRLFELASQLEYEEDFQLSHDQLLQLKNLSDMEIVQTLLWLKQNGGSSQKLTHPASPSLAWCDSKLESNNLRTRFYAFLLFLTHTNPILKEPLSKLLNKL